MKITWYFFKVESVIQRNELFYEQITTAMQWAVVFILEKIFQFFAALLLSWQDSIRDVHIKGIMYRAIEADIGKY